MINGTNARIIIIGLFVSVIILFGAIAALAFQGDPIPPTLTGSVQTIMGVIVGAFALNTKGGDGSPPKT